MKHYQIYPLKLGEFLAAEKSNFAYQKSAGTKLRAPIIAYLIRGEHNNILVDTGCSDPAWAAAYHHPIEQPDEMKIENVLARFFLKPKDITTVINTHLHWDHCFNNHLFENAKIYVQKRELEFAINPIPSQYIYYESPQIGITPIFLRSLKNYVVVDGVYKLQEGIELIPTPGHTPGFQSVLVDTAKGKWLIASDCVGLIENWENRDFGLPVPSGIHDSLSEYYDSLRKMIALTDHVLPGHDPRAFDHEVYPYE